MRIVGLIRIAVLFVLFAFVGCPSPDATPSGPFSVTYDGNGATGGNVPTDGNSYLRGATVTVLGTTGSLVRTGFAFVSWNTAANGSGTTYAGGATFPMGSANVTLYARWSYNEIVIDTYDPVTPSNPVASKSSTMQLWSSDGKTMLASDTAGASRPPTGWPYKFGAYIDYTGGLVPGDYWVLVEASSPGDSFGYGIRVIAAPDSSYTAWNLAAASESVSDQPLAGGSGIPTTFQTMVLNNPPGTPSSTNHLSRSIVSGGVNWIKITLP
jgi:hypothetical protein